MVTEGTPIALARSDARTSHPGPRKSRGVKLLALAALALALASSACFDTSYRCRVDNDCDVGALGRCETDGRCTSFDDTCPTHRRYTEHSEALSNQCFDDGIALANPCAGGQPPARPEGCLRDVCDALPACCETAWSDACVQAAQLRCDLACDTRIAVTALAAGRAPELYDLRRAGSSWTAARITDRDAALAWLAPAPGEVEPRLAGLSGGALVVGGRSYPVDRTHVYQTLASVDLDRDGRDTVALSSVFSMQPVQHAIDVIKLDDGSSRTLQAVRSQHLGWGDNDHDAFPDGIAGFNVGYAVLDNIEAGDSSGTRALSSSTAANVSNADTPPAPPIRGFDWIDLDGDRRLELAVFGTQIRIHLGDVRLANTPVFNRDCDPPIVAGQCAIPEAVAFAGAALPSLDAPALVAATFPARKIFRISVDPRTPQDPSIVLLSDTCPTCAPIIALVARDLDGDRRLDLVGIDTRLHVHTALAAEGHTFRESVPIATALTYVTVELSVSGAPTSAPTSP